MKVPSFELPRSLDPLRLMSAPKRGLAELTKAHRAWSSLLDRVPHAAEAGPATLEEVARFGANPGALRLLRFVPPHLPPGAPLVVALHGCTQTAEGYASGSGWSELAARHGFAVLYPEQVRGNNGNCCFNWFEPGDITRGGGEVASVAAMVADAVAGLRCDPGRVFATGLSAGGAMTAALLATYPDVFAAGAVIAGLPYRCASNTQEALSAMFHPVAAAPAALGNAVRRASPGGQRKPMVSIWHGDADKTVLPANAAESAKQWCDVHQLPPDAYTDDTVDGARRRCWRDAAGVPQVELVMVPGLAHGTPITPGAPGDQGVGEAMPHMLASGISSTWHIARRWGLLRG